MERYILMVHYTPKQEAIEKGNKPYNWFCGKNNISLTDCPDGWSHPETAHLTTNEFLLKDFGYSRKCDAVRVKNSMDKFYKTSIDSKWWDRQVKVLAVTL